VCRGGPSFGRDDLAGSDQPSNHASGGTDFLDAEGGGDICGCGTEVRTLDREEVEVGAGRTTEWGQRVEGGSDGLRQCKSAKADELAWFPCGSIGRTLWAANFQLGLAQRREER
jgi:hypothetical protein